MSQSIGILDITFKAGADLSASQFAPVKLGANVNEVVLAGANEEAIGILQNTPTAGKAASVRLAGTSKVKASAAIAKGAAVVAAANGKVVTAGVQPQNILGLALEAAAADGDIIEMVLRPQRW